MRAQRGVVSPHRHPYQRGRCPANVRFFDTHRTTTTPGGRLVFHVFAALAEFIRELIIEDTNEGLAAARARGQQLGRPPAMTAEQIRHARALLTQPDATIVSIARLFGVSRSTIYKYIPELKTGSDHQAIEVPTARPELQLAPAEDPIK
ncbi:recombinase family protein [Sphaerisporangium sp. NBC_01403]|uniref:helix-turn-helix domain-containing protein n=1 Tax=Sphaerisporangium sp. NBC_01403 TaxID=2903599 RepID=UPI00325097A7